MRRVLLTLLGGYAGAGAAIFLLYRAAHRRTREVRAWTDRRSVEIIDLLDELRGRLRELQQLPRRQRLS